MVVGLAEVGDKTQILSLMLAARFHRPVPIVFGILFATLANHAAAGLAGTLFGSLLAGPWMRWILGLSFLSVAVWALFPVQRHQDLTIIDTDRRAVAEREIIKPKRQADIVDDQRSVGFGDDLANLVFDCLEDLLGPLDARAGWSADVEFDLSAIDQREKVAPNEHEHHRAEGEDGHPNGWQDHPARQQAAEERGIGLPHPFELVLEAAVKAREPAGLRAFVMRALEQHADRDRRQGPR